MANTPDPPERNPPESSRSGLYRAHAKEAQAENVRTDERVDGFANRHIKSLTTQLRVAAALVFFLVGVIVVLAGRDLGFSIGTDGLSFDGGGTVEKPEPKPAAGGDE